MFHHVVINLRIIVVVVVHQKCFSNALLLWSRSGASSSASSSSWRPSSTRREQSSKSCTCPRKVGSYGHTNTSVHMQHVCSCCILVFLLLIYYLLIHLFLDLMVYVSICVCVWVKLYGYNFHPCSFVCDKSLFSRKKITTLFFIVFHWKHVINLWLGGYNLITIFPLILFFDHPPHVWLSPPTPQRSWSARR